jgi:pSer/pThr/pTyr-binding forkhead associated (FHA) protein
MFAVELEFEDGVSQPEIILVRRPQFVIGVSDRAHVVVDGMANCDFELQLVRGIGRTFSYQSLRREDRPDRSYKELKGLSEAEGTFRLGEVTARIRTLDLDLAGLISDSVEPERLAQLFSTSKSDFPALVVFGTTPIAFSLPKHGSLLIGRSRACAVRLDAADISAEHCKVTVSSAGVLIADLGSKNGTWFGEEKLLSERELSPGELVRIGGGTIVTLIRSRKDYQDISKQIPESSMPENLNFDEFPRLSSNLDEVKPQQLILKVNRKVSIGRDPSNDVWINIPHISRRHLEIMLMDDSRVEITDLSSNGSYVNGDRLSAQKPTIVALRGSDLTLDLTGGVNISLELCKPDPPTPEVIDRPHQKTMAKATLAQEICRESSELRNELQESASQVSDTPPIPDPVRETEMEGMFVSEEMEPVEPELPENSPWVRYFLFGVVFMLGGYILFLIVSILFDRSFY